MPLYDYECSQCGHIFELKQSFEDAPVGTCPLCEGQSRRKFHAVPIIYKGSGFYTTDYARADVRANGTTDNDSTESKKNETQKDDSKPVKADDAAAKDKTTTSSENTKQSPKASPPRETPGN